MLKISCTQELNVDTHSDVGRAAATLLRQIVEERWTGDQLHQEDKQTIRDNIVECMAKAADTGTGKSLEDCIRLIAIDDYPDKWTGVLQQIQHGLEDADQAICYGSLGALRAIVSKYQNKLGEERKELTEITLKTFDVMKQLFDKYIKIFDESAVMIMTVLTKIFYIVNYVSKSS